MSIRDYGNKINIQEICLNLQVFDMKQIKTWLRMIENRLKNKNIITVNFCAKIEYREKE